MNKAPLVIQTEHLSQNAAQWLAARCELIVCAYDDPKFTAMLADASALVVRTYTIVDDALLDRAPNLKVIGRAGVGLDNINVASCRQRNIEVVYTPDANTQAVVEYLFCLLGDALRPRVTLTHAIDHAAWNELRNATVGSRQLDHLTIGILGLGRVGKRVAQVASAFGMRVLFNDIMDIPPDQRHGANAIDVRSLFAQSDVVTVHIDGRPSNAKFVNADLIHQMKPDAIFINTSRGFVIDNASLAQWLAGHPAAIALLDVHHPEPFGPDYPLLGLPNARLYPHLASRTETAMNNMSWVVKDVVAVFEGRSPQFPAPSR